MSLRFRRTASGDLGECLALIRDGFAYTNSELALLTRLWREVLDGDLGVSAVVEETEARQPHILAFGLSAFVSDAFLAEAKTSLPPYLGPRILHRWAERRSPIATRAEIRRANAGSGLNVLALHHGWDDGIEGPQLIAAQQLLAQSFNELHAGYNIREFLQEVNGDEIVRHYLAIGARLRKGYASRPAPFPPPAGREPHLVGITRDEAMERPGTLATGIFVYSPPRLGFTAAERELLRFALYGHTDEELAATLRLSIAAVKKRWESIYGRSASLEGMAVEAPRAAPGRRGAEKKRHLLAYVREHPEELRP